MENNVNDSSSNHINGTIIGDPMFVANDYPGYGKALAFDANQDCVDLGVSEPNEGFNFAGSFTIAFWAKIDDWSTDWSHAMMATRGEGVGFSIRKGGSYVAGLQGAPTDGLSFTTRGIGLANTNATYNEDMIVAKPTIGAWTHIVCMFDKANLVKKVYYNSKLVVSKPILETKATLTASTFKASLAGRANSSNTGFENLYKGSLDDVRFYNRALTDEEVRFLADPTP